MQMMGRLFPFAQLLEGSGNSQFQRTLEAISAQSPTHVQMVRLDRFYMCVGKGLLCFDLLTLRLF